MHWPPGLCSSWCGFSQAARPGKSVVPSLGRCWVEPGWCRWGSSSQLLAPGQGPPTAAIPELCGTPSPTQSPCLVLRGAVRLLKPGRPCRTAPPHPKSPRGPRSATLSQGQLSHIWPQNMVLKGAGPQPASPLPSHTHRPFTVCPQGSNGPLRSVMQRVSTAFTYWRAEKPSHAPH